MYAPEDAGRLCNMGHYQSPNMVRDCFRSSEPPFEVWHNHVTCSFAGQLIFFMLLYCRRSTCFNPLLCTA